MKAVLLLALTLGATSTLGAMMSFAMAEPVRSQGSGLAELPRFSKSEAVPRVLLGFGAEPNPEPNPAERSGSRAGPVRLGAAEMDAITAGLAAVDVTALAVALGPAGYTGADTRTRALGHHLFEIAYGLGDAHAAGETTAVDLSTTLYADGGIVIGERFVFTLDIQGYSEGRTGGFVVAVDPDHPRLAVVQRTAERLATLLRRDSDRLTRRAERGPRLFERSPRLGLRYLSYLKRDYDRLESHFQDGIGRLLDHVARE